MQQALDTITKLLQQHLVVQDPVLSPDFGVVSKNPQPQPSLSFLGPDADTEFTAVGRQGFVFESLDLDRDGHINREEYNGGFHVMDRDCDGKLSDANACLSREEYEAGFDLLDTGRDGFITKSEFTKSLLNHSEALFQSTIRLPSKKRVEGPATSNQVLSQKHVNILDPIKDHHDRKQEPQPVVSIENGAMYKLAPRVDRIRNQGISSSTMLDALAPRIERIRNKTTRSDSRISRFASADVVTVDFMRRRMRTSNEQPLTSDPLPFSMSLALSPPHSALSSLVFPPPQLPPLLPLSQILRDTSLCSQSPFTRDFRETPQSSNPASYNNIHHSPAKLS